MCGLKTLALMIAAIAALPGQSSAASGTTTPTEPDLMLHFAACTGRLSALMEHQWLTDGPASEVTRAQRDTMASLLDAVTPPALAVRAMSLRIEVKAAHAALLSRAHFGRDEVAARRARSLVAGCSAMLLG